LKLQFAGAVAVSVAVPPVQMDAEEGLIVGAEG
jgi:hypothetical protein